MICSKGAEDGYIRIGISSAGFNVMNFILFDILLAALLFYLTGVIAGLVNCLSAVKAFKNRISTYEKPFIGPGLTCTNRNVFRILAIVRGVMMILVFATNFLVEGASCTPVKLERHQVLVPGPLNASFEMGKKEVRKHRTFGLRRKGCRGIRPDNFTYYGELRLNGKCELREELMAFPPIIFGDKVLNRTVHFPQPCTRIQNHRGIENRFDCPELGTILCLRSMDQIFCWALVELPDESGQLVGQMCKSIGGDGEHLHLGNNSKDVHQNKARPGRFARCIQAKNIDVTQTEWASGALLTVHSFALPPVIDILYGADFREMNVKVVSENDEKQVTDVHVIWFAVLGVALFMLLSLSIVVMWFRSKGLVPAANSEPRIGSLILNCAIHNTPRDAADKPRILISLSPDGTPRLYA